MSEHECIHLCAGQMPAAQHLALWREICARQCAVEPLQADWHFLGDLYSWRVAGLLITEQRCCATRYTRDPALSAGDGTHWLVLRVIHRGSHLLQIQGTETMLDASTLSLQDWAIPHVATATPHEMTSVGFAREDVRAANRLGRHKPLLCWAADTPEGQLLRTTVNSLLAALHAGQAPAADAIANGLRGVVGGLLEADARITEPDEPRGLQCERSAIATYVEQHLRDKHLSEASVRAQLDCSRTTLYRVFAAEGGLSRYIQRRRLKACLTDLQRLQPKPASSTMLALTRDWGFRNIQHFQRQLQAHPDLQRAHVAPGRTHRDGLDSLYAAAQLRQWLNQGG